ncbi:hypothetical protein B0I35DRAFT_450512 [Stachybotrys elegans]|uniref:Uncharacterized protein n=1 Tax=Stachybotrys elegans TaxID=80388 RepID=A0A8K0WT66_9HYPO|nr:hypothetical protein B0I35DRAFT_450512 [Stachybotrys elegans]
MSAALPTNTTTAEAFAAKYADIVAGKTIMTTGVSPNSIGSAFVTALATQKPSTLILAGRNAAKLQQTADAIAKVNADVKVKTLIFDMLSFADVRRAAAEVMAWEDVPAIDVLVNNAGVMAVPYALTVDGVESHLAANHLAHFLFTNLIMDKILASPAPRVVNITSDGHRMSAIRSYDHNFDNGKTYNRWVAYAQSKTANMLFSKSLAEKLGKRGLLSYSVHPGLIMSTSLASHLDMESFVDLAQADRDHGNFAGWLTAADFPKYEVSVEVGAATHVFASFEPSLKDHNGTYLLDARVADPYKDTYRSWARDPIEADQLWTLSEKFVGQEFSY